MFRRRLRGCRYWSVVSVLLLITLLTRNLSVDPLTTFLSTTNLSVDPPTPAVPRNLCFVHLGKSGGTALGCSLGPQVRATLSNRNLCPAGSERVGSALHAAVRGRVHLAPAPVFDSRYDAFLVTLRDPVQRMVSWYFYLHPNFLPVKKPKHIKFCHNMVFFRCWPTLQNYTEIGLDVRRAGNSTCDAWAHDITRGTRHCWQNYWNYERSYGNLLRTEKQVYAIRTEHLSRDVDGVESALSGSVSGRAVDAGHTLVGGAVERVNGSGRTVDKLSLLGRRNLCRALCREIQVYKNILGRAVNLSPAEKQETLGELAETCPLEADGADCGKHGGGVLQEDPLIRGL